MDAETASGPAGFWTAVLIVGLLALAGVFFRVVGRDERVVVTRAGRVARVAGPGIVLRWPALEQATTVSMRPVEMPLVVSAATREGIPVHVVTTAVCEPLDPAVIAQQEAPFDVTALAVEDALQAQIASRGLVELLPLSALEAVIDASVRPRAAAEWGTALTNIQVTGVEASLTTALLRAVRAD
jgi:regulator of protease activity HflC (stomatin/prohibitin superfamily)